MRFGGPLPKGGYDAQRAFSAAEDAEYFSDGLAEDIINALAQILGLKVIARTSAFAF